MKLLIDVCLSPHWVRVFEAAGWTAEHWSRVGRLTAEDTEVLSWALDNGYIVFTHDLDFGAILAATQAPGPSVVQLREQDTDPDVIGEAVVAGIQQCAERLAQGALVTIDLRRAKARILPLVRDDST